MSLGEPYRSASIALAAVAAVMSDGEHILRTWQELNEDLSNMADSFVRLVKASKMPVDEGDAGIARSGATFATHVENLVAVGNDVLSQVDSCKKSAILANSDKALYEKVRSTKFKLKAVSEKEHSILRDTQAGPVLELRNLLQKLEEHYYRSKSRPKDTGTTDVDQQLNEFCSEAMFTDFDAPGA